MASPPPQQSYELPPSASDSLGDPNIKLVLHCISFSHYCERARWTLRLLGIPYEEVNYLPLLHMPGILRLQRKFKQAPGPPTASSKSPAATPCLALYSAAGQPLCLLQDSALICRYAVLRAHALKLPYATDLYGLPALNLTPAPNNSNSSSSGAAKPGAAGSPAGSAADAVSATSSGVRVAGGDGRVQELDVRLGGTLGIEVRRVLYHHLLPLPAVGGGLFVNNSSGSKLLARLVYYLCRLLLPRLMRINAATAARGQQKLLAEFDFLDSLLLQQQQQQGVGRSAGGSEPGSLPYYLCGPKMTEADIQLACLAGPLLCIPEEFSTTWTPPLELLPQDLQAYIKVLQRRPTGNFVLDMWRVHGPGVSSSAGAEPLRSAL